MKAKLIRTYRGHDIYFLHISYNCPTLNLFGYAKESQIMAAIRKRTKV